MAEKKIERHAQLIRQWQLLRELMANEKGLHYLDLAKRAGVAPKTVYRDLHTLVRAGFPVERAKIGRKEVWCVKGRVAPPILFTPLELQALALGAQMIQSNLGAPLSDAVIGAVKKLRGQLTEDQVRIVDVTNMRFLARPSRKHYYTDIGTWFKALHDAMHRSRTLRIKYHSEHRQADTEREFDPYGMVLNDGIYYVIGLCRMRNEVRTFRVDRISFVADTGKTFVVPKDFSPAKHLGSAWGVLNQHMETVVRVRFEPRTGGQVRKIRWHVSESFAEQPDGSVIMTVKVAGLNEIKRWIMGFGSAAEVLEPPELRAQIASHVEAMRDRYARTGSRVSTSGVSSS